MFKKITILSAMLSLVACSSLPKNESSTTTPTQEVTIPEQVVVSTKKVMGLEDRIWQLVELTRSANVGKIQDGEIVRSGGWGIELDDEGSGAWIGREGLNAIVRGIDGRSEQTALYDMLIEQYPMLKKDKPRTIVSAYAERIFEYHTLTPMVMKCAENGDTICYDIIDRSAKHLVDNIVSVRRKYNNSKDIIEVACMGGMLENDTLLLRLLNTYLREVNNITVVSPVGTALEGALRLGHKLLQEYED